MNKELAYSVVVIGGSAGSFSAVMHILKTIPPNFSVPVVVCMHRLKHVNSGYKETLELISENKVIEPFHNDILQAGCIYIAPANYHIMVESDAKIMFSTEELVNYSRPSIDVLFRSAAYSFGKKVLGIILSGAHTDGADGLRDIHVSKGTTIVQNPSEAEVSTMPQAAIDKMKPSYILHLQSIEAFLQILHTEQQY
ncbi:MAG: chemotaxis protein CheB [Bacteroidales bacterium]